MPSLKLCKDAPHILNQESTDTFMADTSKVTDKLDRKKLKRAARKKAAPKGKRTTPRGENKAKIKKATRGKSKR